MKLSKQDEELIHHIKKTTETLNANNITRTNAYLYFYQQHPEIHWSFLAHMVSRNTGWNMTDLKGTFLPRLLSKTEIESFFSFLERGNWVIFQDAYPQLLLYEESKKAKRNLSHLLPHLNVSIFMEVIWNHFWNHKDSFILTCALIVNEQNLLEKIVVADPHYQKNVFNQLEFTLQDLLAMNQILFPYHEKKAIKLIGKTVHHFENLHSRITFGKELYHLLFADLPRLRKIERWANSTLHNASRQNYWRHIFHHVNEELPGQKYTARLKSCRLVPNAPRLYSPALEFVWKDRAHSSPVPIEWYRDSSVLSYLVNHKSESSGDIEKDYCRTLEKLEFASLAKKAISIF